MSKYDELAGRLEQRLTGAPTRGRAAGRRSGPHTHDDETRAERDADAPEPSRRRRTTPTAVSDHRPPARRRGHLVPADLHRAARRRKTLESEVGRTTWTDVMVAGVTELLERSDLVEMVAALPDRSGPTRLVQAALPPELDRRLAACHLDLQDEVADSVTYEQLWELAIRLWVER